MWLGLIKAASSLLSIVSSWLGLAKTNQDEKAGVAMQVAADNTAASKAQTAEAQAEAQAPKSQSDLAARAENGTF